jgi:DNA-binding NarL/FixJ family response regulator
VRHGLRAFLGSEPDIDVVGEAAGGAQAVELLASTAAVRAAHRGELQIDPVVAKGLMSSLHEAGSDDAISELTSRELDVLRLVAAGEPNKQIAAELAISERTARTHVSRILRKLRLSSRTQAALWAVREGLVEVKREPR